MKSIEDGFLLTIFVENRHCSASKDECLTKQFFHHFNNKKLERNTGYSMDAFSRFWRFLTLPIVSRSFIRILNTLRAHVHFMMPALNISGTTTARIKKINVHVKNHSINSGSHQVSLVADRS